MQTYFVLFLHLIVWNIFSGCAGKDINENDPVALFSDAEDDIKDDHFQIALDKLRTVKNKFPYSKYAVDAHLRIADVYFLQESFIEAASNYESFSDLHPKHERVPYAKFRIGKSYFNDIPSPYARDLTSAQKAMGAYIEFLKQFPQAPEVLEAKKDLIEVRKILAEKELYIADFYYKQDIYSSAKIRYQKILELYPETESAQKSQVKLQKIQELNKND